MEHRISIDPFSKFEKVFRSFLHKINQDNIYYLGNLWNQFGKMEEVSIYLIQKL